MTYELPAVGRPPAPPPLEKIAVEEHFSFLPSGHLQALVRSMDYDTRWMDLIHARLPEFERDRIAAMDESGIRLSVLSHTVPGVQGIVDRGAAVAAARETNDFRAGVVSRRPARFAGFARVPLQDPAEAAREVERAFTRLGLKGVMVNGYTNTADPSRGEYLDEEKFLPFWEAVAALGVPVYGRPSSRPAMPATRNCWAQPGASRPRLRFMRCALSTADSSIGIPPSRSSSAILARRCRSSRGASSTVSNTTRRTNGSPAGCRTTLRTTSTYRRAATSATRR